MREKIKPEAVAPARRQLAGQEEKPGESTVDSRRHKDVWGPQEGEPRAVIKTACADCRGSSVGYGLQEKLGLWEEGSPGEAGTSQLWRRRHRSRPGTGASKERDCRETQSRTATASEGRFLLSTAANRAVPEQAEGHALRREKRKHLPCYDPGCEERKGPDVKASSQL